MEETEATGAIESKSRLHRILVDVSKIAAPSGIVATFCQVLGLPAITSAVVVLGVTAVICLCLYRAAINAKIPSTLVLFLLTCLTGVFFAGYHNILLKDTGLERFYRKSADIQPDLRSSIDHASQEIWFFGTNFHISATDQREALLERLRNGVIIRYLVYDPYSKSIGQLAADFDQPENELQSECLNGLISLVDLAKRWKAMSSNTSSPGELEIRVYESTPRARAYVFDPRISASFSYIVPYINNVNSPELPAFKFSNVSTGVYKAYFGGVQKLWQASTPLDKLSSSHPELKV